jgi:cytochrome c peroxidase
MRRLALGLAVAAAVVAAGALAGGTARQPGPGFRFDLPAGIAPPAIPADNPMSPIKVELGRRLFYDADLSVDGTMSCATCHEQKRAFTDGNATHPGVRDAPGRRNPMGLANVAYFSTLTWADPRPRTLDAQALTPLEGKHPVEMGMKGMETELVRRLEADPCYREMFRTAFPEHGGRIAKGDAVKAIAAFERTLLSFDSPYDRARRGEVGAMPPAARRGARLFFGPAGCASCHSGANFTDGRFHRIAPPTSKPSADRGLFELTGRAADADAFRTASLRNVALTGPYLHDGSAGSIDEAIGRHRWTPEGRLEDPRRRAELRAFLEALTDRGFTTRPALTLPGPGCPAGGQDAS